jgi:putative membrane protein
MLQIFFGAATMLFFGFMYIGSRKTLTFFLAAIIISFVLGLLSTDLTVSPGIFFAGTTPALTHSGLLTYCILLAWFYMGFTSYLLASKLATRLGLRSQTLWALILGTYFLLAWDLALEAVVAGSHLPTQLARANLLPGLPVEDALRWAFNGLLVLVVSRFLWRANLDTSHLTVWLPFAVYTANIGFVILLSFGAGLWFPLLLSTVLVLAPESLAFFPREQDSKTPERPARLIMAQCIWLIMRLVSHAWDRQMQIQVEGAESIPRSGPVLIAARHFHFFYDGFILVRTVPRRLHTIVALDWVQMQGLRLLTELGCVLAGWPVVLRPEQLQERPQEGSWAFQRNEGRRYLRQVMQAATRLLRSGEVLVIFPEGYPNIDPHPTQKTDLSGFLPFRAGFVKMVEMAERDRQTQVAIVPAGLSYQQDRAGHWKATIRFGQAFYLRDFSSLEDARQAIETSVQELSYALSPADALPSPEETSS